MEVTRALHEAQAELVEWRAGNVRVATYKKWSIAFDEKKRAAAAAADAVQPAASSPTAPSPALVAPPSTGLLGKEGGGDGSLSTVVLTLGGEGLRSE